MSTMYFSMPKQLMTAEYSNFSVSSKMLFSILFTHAETAQDITNTAELINSIPMKELIEMKKQFRQHEKDGETMFNYFYGNETRQYQFYTIPQMLFIDEKFKKLSCEAKVLYGLLLDRSGLSAKNDWIDDKGRVYVYFRNTEICELLGCQTQKAVKIMKELDASTGIGLIERKKQGQGKPDRIYVCNFNSIKSADNDDSDDSGESNSTQEGEAQTDSDFSDNSESKFLNFENHKSKSLNCENQNSGTLKITNQEFRKSKLPIYNQTNRTILSESYQSNQSESESESQLRAAEMMDKIDGYTQMVKENIDYDFLVSEYEHPQRRPFGSKAELDELVAVMVDAICSTKPMLNVNGTQLPQAVVAGQLLKLDSEHITYVLDSLARNTKNIINMKSYLLTSLYNAPMTSSSKIQADFRKDFPQYAKQ